MYIDMDNLKFLGVIKGSAKGYRVYSNRPSHGLVFKVRGATVYNFNGKHIELKQGEIMIIPKGSSYTVGHTAEGESSYIAVNFDTKLSDDIPRVCRIKDSADFIRCYTQLERLWAVQTDANKLRCMAILCEMLAEMEQNSNQNSQAGGDMALLKPALEHLELNIFEPDLKISELHALCGVSDTYFRKVFASCFGKSPKKYVQERRLAQAKAVIDNGEYNNIYEVARQVGFEDPLYFGKVFKKKYGYPPSEKK